MSKENREATVVEGKQGFLTYLGSFFTGWLFKDAIEEEIRAATKIPHAPPISLRDIFKAESWKTISGNIKTKGVWSALAKEAGIHGASIIPGAAIGYFVLKPVLTVHSHEATKDASNNSIAAAAPQITEAQSMGKVQPEPTVAVSASK